MSKPTGRLAFAYATIARLEARIAELEAVKKDLTPLYAEQPAPVAVVMPERFNVVIQYLMGIGDLEGYYFRDSHPSGRKYWWRNELRACLNGITP